MEHTFRPMRRIRQQLTQEEAVNILKSATSGVLAARYSNDTVTAEMTDKEIAGGFNRLLMVEISIEHITGKEAIELVKQKS